MLEAIKKIRASRNIKYYDLVVSFFDVINDVEDKRIRFSVDEILEHANISRPTFYSYYRGVEEFYVDLMDIIATVWPEYLQTVSKRSSTEDLLSIAFQAKLGVTLGNMKKVAGTFPKVLKPWKTYFDKAVLEMGSFYVRMLKIPQEEGEKLSRMILNELILHPEIYYTDFEKYRTLMLHQKTA